jgi:predicted nucleotide-binding protein
VLAVDKDADWIEAHITVPRREGRAIFVGGRDLTWVDVQEIHITETNQTIEQLIPQVQAQGRASGLITTTSDEWFAVTGGQDVTEEFITGPPGTGPEADEADEKATSFASDRKAVMVIYGHDVQANEALFDWLRAIGLSPREWSQLVQASGSGSPYIGNVLEKALQDVQAVVAFFTPDEYVTAADAQDGAGWLQARPNVLIEAGMALVSHPTRTIIVVLGSQELPSDISGRHYVRLSHTAVPPLHDLAERLRVAGCETDTTGTIWLDPTRFPDRDAPKPFRNSRERSAEIQPGNEGQSSDRQETQPRDDVQRLQEDMDARQVTVIMEKKSGEAFSHLVTVSTPLTYPIKQVDGRLAWQTNGGLGMTSFGYAGDPPRADDHRRRYTFRVSVSPQIHSPEPIIRFVDLHENLYYQFRDHTQRFSQNIDWNQAARVIDEWLRTGPKADLGQRETSRGSSGPIRLIPDPAKPASQLLKLCRTGEDLWRELSRSYSFHPSCPDDLTDDQTDAVDSLLEPLRAWLDMTAEESFKERRQASRELTEEINKLADLGLLVGTRTRYLLLTGGISAEPSHWRSFDIEFQLATEAQLRNADGTRLAQEKSSQPSETSRTEQ